jgi:hypothetical protein
MAPYANSTNISALHLVGLLLGLQIFMFPFSHTAFANQDISHSPWSLLEHHNEQLLQLSADDDALAFFLSLSHSHTKASQTTGTSTSSSKDMKKSEEMKEVIPTYIASLAVTAYARAIRTSLIESTTTGLPSSEINPEEPRFQWMMKQVSLDILNSVIDFYNQLSFWSQTTTRPLPPGDDFAEFASYYDRTYPNWDNAPSSWITLFQQQGPKGIETRLLEYWQASDQAANRPVFSQSIHDAYAQHYLHTRLLPMFRATLLSQTIGLEATGYETAWESWRHIQQEQQQDQTQSAIARLCGTWRWIVHNHQNHGDHKATITFSPPDEPSSSHIQPATIRIQGDTVYLRWTFPQGIQEDSLLFSNHDTHLEGTFKNSLGPHGSISGKRLSPCRS